MVSFELASFAGESLLLRTGAETSSAGIVGSVIIPESALPVSDTVPVRVTGSRVFGADLETVCFSDCCLARSSVSIFFGMASLNFS